MKFGRMGMALVCGMSFCSQPVFGILSPHVPIDRVHHAKPVLQRQCLTLESWNYAGLLKDSTISMRSRWRRHGGRFRAIIRERHFFATDHLPSRFPELHSNKNLKELRSREKGTRFIWSHARRLAYAASLIWSTLETIFVVSPQTVLSWRLSWMTGILSVPLHLFWNSTHRIAMSLDVDARLPIEINAAEFPAEQLSTFLGSYPPFSKVKKRTSLLDRIRTERTANGAFESWADLMARVSGLGEAFERWLKEDGQNRLNQVSFDVSDSAVQPSFKTKASRQNPFEDDLERLGHEAAETFAAQLAHFLQQDLRYSRAVELMDQQFQRSELRPSDYNDAEDRQRLLDAFRFLSMGTPLAEPTLKKLLGEASDALIGDALRLGIFIREKGQIRMNGLSVVPIGRRDREAAYVLVDSFLPGRYVSGQRRVYIGLDSFNFMGRLQHLQHVSGVLVEPFSGSGIQLILFLLSHPDADILGWGVESDTRALHVSRFNTLLNGVSDKITFVPTLEMLDQALQGRDIDGLIMNFPYVQAPDRVELVPILAGAPKEFATLAPHEVREIGKAIPLIDQGLAHPTIDVSKLLHKAGWGGLDGLSVLDRFMGFLYPRLKNHGVMLLYGDFLGDDRDPVVVRQWLNRWPGLHAYFEPHGEPVSIQVMFKQLRDQTVDYAFGMLPTVLQKKITYRIVGQLERELQEYAQRKGLSIHAVHKGTILAEKHVFSSSQLDLIRRLAVAVNRFSASYANERDLIERLLRLIQTRVVAEFGTLAQTRLRELINRWINGLPFMSQTTITPDGRCHPLTAAA